MERTIKKLPLKWSIFNSVLSLGSDSLAIYNAKENMVIITKGDHKRIIEKGENAILEGGLPDSLYREFVKKKFIVARKTNEAEELKDLRKQLYEDDSKFILTVNPTINCNLNCWYCYETKTKSKMSDLNKEAIEKFVQKTITGIRNLKRFEITFFGGEPLLFYKQIIAPLMAKTAQLCSEGNIKAVYGFTTNGVLLNSERIKELSNYSRIVFQITLDGCERQHDGTRFLKSGKGTYKTIVNNIKELCAYDNFHITLRFNCTKDNVDSLVDVLKDFEDVEKEKKLKNITVAFEQVWQDFKNGSLTEKLSYIKREFEAAGFYIGERDTFRFARWCEGNKKNSAIINYNGEVFKCSARDYTSESKEGVLLSEGEILWDAAKVNERYNALFSSNLCYECRIAPVCTERCSQKNLEDKRASCVYSEAEKDEIVLDRIYHMVHYQ